MKICVLSESNSKMETVANIFIDGVFVVNDIKVLYANERFFIAMPSKPKIQGGFIDIAHPINETRRKIIETTIMYAYNKVVENDATILELAFSNHTANILDFDRSNYEFTVVETKRHKKKQTTNDKQKSPHLCQDDNWQKWFNS